MNGAQAESLRRRMAALFLVSLASFFVLAAPEPVCPTCSIKEAEFTIRATGQNTAATVETAFVIQVHLRPSTVRVLESGDFMVRTSLTIMVEDRIGHVLTAEESPARVQTGVPQNGSVALDDIVRLWDRPRDFSSPATVVAVVELIDASDAIAAQTTISQRVDVWPE